MNDNRQIAFLSSLRSPRNELRAVVMSSGVSFSVVAFQGLQTPIPKTSYDSFSAPSINDAGVICFAAELKDTEGNPSSAIIRVEGSKRQGPGDQHGQPSGNAGRQFPGILSAFNQLSGKHSVRSALGREKTRARVCSSGRRANCGGWTFQRVFRRRLKTCSSRSSSATMRRRWRSRGTPGAAAIEQFFRAVAIRSFQEINPAPDPADTVQLLAPRAGQAPVQISSRHHGRRKRANGASAGRSFPAGDGQACCGRTGDQTRGADGGSDDYPRKAISSLPQLPWIRPTILGSIASAGARSRA